MRSLSRRLGPLLLLLPLTAGCAELSMTTVDSQERVLSRRQKIQPSATVQVDANVDGTRLTVHTTRGCELVASEEVERTDSFESDEDPTEEWTLFWLMSAPITSGAVLLADAQNVYDSDRNSRQYNPVGKTGAYVGGGILLGAGVLLAAIPFVQLVRIGSASDEQTTTSSRTKSVIQPDVPCDMDPTPVRASVSLRAGSSQVNRNTDANGQLFVDLADAIDPVVAEQQENLEIHVANKLVDVIPMAIIRQEQRRRLDRRDEDGWSRSNAEACRIAPADNDAACAGVRSYLSQFPNGNHASEARELLIQHKTLQIAADPGQASQPPNAPDDPVLKRAKERAVQACATSCRISCVGKGARDAVQTCSNKCIAEVCQ